MTNLIFIGAGDCAEFVWDSVPKDKYCLSGFIDEMKTGAYMGRPIIGDRIDKISRPEDFSYFITIAEPRVRERWFYKLTSMNLKLVNIIDPSAIISEGSVMGTGNYIGKGSVINTHVMIGQNNMIVSTATIEHHSYIGNHTRIAPGATVNGNVIVEDCVFLGSNSCCIGDQKIGAFSIIGAGAVVLKDVKPGSKMVGVPARPMY